MGTVWRLGFLGPKGTFSEDAARTYVAVRGGSIPEFVPYPTIDALLYDVDDQKIECGVAPAENSIEGTIAITLDLLVHEVDLLIQGEVVIPVRHNLLAKAGVAPETVRAVLSHPQALAQCRRRLRELVPQAEIRTAKSTAEAAAIVAHEAPGLAALGTTLAAEVYGLEVLVPDVQDQSENATRFLVLGKEMPSPTGCDKTSVVFAFYEDRPGNLHRALGVFAERHINLTKLESRPAKRILGDYIFFVDMEGHHQDALIAEALAELQGLSSFYKLLGSYPRVSYGRRAGNGG